MKIIRTEPLTVWDLLEEIERLKNEGDIIDSTPIIYSADDEGNSFQANIHLPWIMILNETVSEYWQRIDADDICDETQEPNGFISLCIN